MKFKITRTQSVIVDGWTLDDAIDDATAAFYGDIDPDDAGVTEEWTTEEITA